MAQEIERKFLVRDESWKVDVSEYFELRQGYLNTPGKASIRVRVDGRQAFLNIKSVTLGIQRHEYEYPIPLADANEMLDLLCEGPRIEKTRYHVRHGEHLWEIDVFHGDNNGLVVAEIELSSADERFARPDWLGEEVSHDPRYFNVSLVRLPYKDWALS
ncbi:MAG: CYTH domain-containing protein [Halothiobacillaceae bacterium]|nr:CYTH domain-containing protein [Halothiobacillaceae bacterium]